MAIALVATRLIAFLLITVMRGRMRNSLLEQEKLQLESETLKAKQTNLQESLEFKDLSLIHISEPTRPY